MTQMTQMGSESKHTMTGHEYITKERIDQIEKHGFTVEGDARIGAIKLAVAAQAIQNCEADEWPDELDAKVFAHIMLKPLEEQWAIAGAFLAAAIDVRKRERAKRLAESSGTVQAGSMG